MVLKFPETFQKVQKLLNARKATIQPKIEWKFLKISVNLVRFRKFWKMLFHSSPKKCLEIQIGIFHPMECTLNYADEANIVNKDSCIVNSGPCLAWA